MPQPPLTDDALKAAVALRAAHASEAAAARAGNLHRATLRHQLKRAAERGLMGTKPVLPGFVLQSTSTQRGPQGETEREWLRQRPAPGPAFAVPKGHRVKGMSALTDPEGRTLLSWIKTAERPADVLATAALLKRAFHGLKPAAPAAAPAAPADDDLLTLFPLADWHVGLYAWGAETGANWDLKIAETRIGAGVADLVARTAPAGHALVLGGGDLMHSDTNENKTARSGHALDVDGRYQKVLMTACRLVVRTVEACLGRHGRVTVRILPGNHDEHASVAVAYFLAAWYRADPRVAVDLDPSLFFWHRFGRVLLGATHGHTVKIADMPAIMAHRRAGEWGETRFRYVHGFHLHHSARIATEGNGVIAEIHQTPTPQDAWHFGSGFLSGRSLQAITYHRDYGEVSRSRVAILDGDTA